MKRATDSLVFWGCISGLAETEPIDEKTGDNEGEMSVPENRSQNTSARDSGKSQHHKLDSAAVFAILPLISDRPNQSWSMTGVINDLIHAGFATIRFPVDRQNEFGPGVFTACRCSRVRAGLRKRTRDEFPACRFILVRPRVGIASVCPRAGL